MSKLSTLIEQVNRMPKPEQERLLDMLLESHKKRLASLGQFQSDVVNILKTAAERPDITTQEAMELNRALEANSAQLAGQSTQAMSTLSSAYEVVRRALEPIASLDNRHKLTQVQLDAARAALAEAARLLA